MDDNQARIMNEAPRIHAMLLELAGEMSELHLGYPDMLLRTWKLRAEAISRATPSPLRAEVLSLLGRIGIRWGLVHAVRGHSTLALDKNSGKYDLTGLRQRPDASARSCVVAKTGEGIEVAGGKQPAGFGGGQPFGMIRKRRRTFSFETEMFSDPFSQALALKG